MSPLRENNLPFLLVHPLHRHPISTFQVVAAGHFRDWSLIMWRGVYNDRVGQVKFFPYEEWGGRKSFRSTIFPFCSPPPPLSVMNDQSFTLANFEGLFLLSLLEIKRELCKLITSTSQGIHRYKVPVVGKNGKLNETIEVGALWSIGILSVADAEECT